MKTMSYLAYALAFFLPVPLDIFPYEAANIALTVRVRLSLSLSLSHA